MSLFGSLMADVEDDPFFGLKLDDKDSDAAARQAAAVAREAEAAAREAESHMRQMRHMHNVMNSLMDPFAMMGGAMAIGAPRHGSALMPFMPQMPPMNRLLSADLSDGHMGAGSSFSSSTVVMSSGPNGKPQVYSSTSSTKIGPNGVKETRKTLQDSRTGTKKMSIGHHIGERAHVIEREQNVYSGDAEERQEFINLEEEEAEDFDREFQHKSGAGRARAGRELLGGPRAAPRLALPAPPAAHAATSAANGDYRRPQPRRPLRASASPLATASSASASVREVYGGVHPQCHRHHKHRTMRHGAAAAAAAPAPAPPALDTASDDDDDQ